MLSSPESRLRGEGEGEKLRKGVVVGCLLSLGQSLLHPSRASIFSKTKDVGNPSRRPARRLHPVPQLGQSFAACPRCRCARWADWRAHRPLAQPEDLAYHLTDHLRLNGTYWALMALYILGREDALDKKDMVAWVKSCWDDKAGEFDVALRLDSVHSPLPLALS